MPYEEMTTSKQGLLMLTGAVLQLIQTSTSFDLEPRPQRETTLLAYHRIKQSELLNQLFEVIHLRITTLSAIQQFSPLSSAVVDNEDMEFMESSFAKLLEPFSNLQETESSPNLEYLLSIERLRNKMFPAPQANGTELSADPSANSINAAMLEVKTEIKEITRSVVSPILHWSRNAPKKTTKSKNKKDDFYQIKIGSNTYRGFL